MRSTARNEVGTLESLPRGLLLRVARQLFTEKIELIEEVRQLRAAVNIYREVSKRTDHLKSGLALDSMGGLAVNIGPATELVLSGRSVLNIGLRVGCTCSNAWPRTWA
jgi:hypothetical protein